VKSIDAGARIVALCAASRVASRSLSATRFGPGGANSGVVLGKGRERRDGRWDMEGLNPHRARLAARTERDAGAASSAPVRRLDARARALVAAREGVR